MRAAKLFAVLALAVAAARPVWSQVTVQLIKDTASKTPAPPAQPTKQAASAEDDQARMEKILTDVKNGTAITKADQKWALDETAKDLKAIDSGEAEKEIMTVVESKIDQAIKDGKIPADKKPEFMKAFREKVKEKLAEMKDDIKAAAEALKKAKTK
jgi:hypothetical protein